MNTVLAHYRTAVDGLILMAHTLNRPDVRVDEVYDDGLAVLEQEIPAIAPHLPAEKLTALTTLFAFFREIETFQQMIVTGMDSRRSEDRLEAFFVEFRRLAT